MLTVAILRRALEELRARLAANGTLGEELEIGCRPETLLRAAHAFADCIGRALNTSSSPDFRLVCERKTENVLPHSLNELSPDVWGKMKLRFLKTLPTPTPEGWTFDLKTRPGERLLKVPNDGRILEEYLKDPLFLAELRERLLSSGVQLKAPTSVRVGGAFLSEAWLDHVYVDDAAKREAASRLDQNHWQTLTPEVVEALRTGAFDLIPVQDRPAHELLAQLKRLLKDRSRTVVVNSDPDLDLRTLRPFVKGRLYGWTPAPNPRAADARLMCNLDPSKNRSDLARVKTIMVFRKAQS